MEHAKKKLQEIVEQVQKKSDIYIAIKNVKKRQSKLPMTEVYLPESPSKLNIKSKHPYRNCPEKDEQIDKNKNEKKIVARIFQDKKDLILTNKLCI